MSTPACEAGTIVAWDDIETVRETLPDGCEIRLLGPVPEPETAGERHQRSVEWVIAGNDPADFPEIEMAYPDGIIVDTTQEVSTEIGELVPSYRVEDARAAGASVYVSRRGDGSGLIVDPNGPLPDQVRADIEDIPTETVGLDAMDETAQLLDDQIFAMRDSGIRAFRVVYVNLQPEHGPGSWSVQPLGFQKHGEPSNTLASTREGALARAAEVFADWGWGQYEVIG